MFTRRVNVRYIENARYFKSLRLVHSGQLRILGLTRLLVRSGFMLLAVLTFMVRIGHALWKDRGWFRMKLGEAGFSVALLHIVRIVALGTNPPAFLSAFLPQTYALAVNAIAPVTIDLAMALTA